MKTTVIFLISVFMVGSSIISLAQHTGASADQQSSPVKTNATNVQDTTPPMPVSGSQNQKLKQKGEKGQIYIGNDWPTGTIVLRNGGVIDTCYLRYNFLTDQIQYISGMDTLIFADPQALNKVTFDGHTFIYEPYQVDTLISKGYFELIVPGKNKLMLKRSVINQKPDAKYPNDKSLTKYQVDECYFISKPGVPANKLACNRKSVLTFLNGHDADIEEYLRITGNKVRTIEDLKLLVSYYNSLDEEY